MYKIYFAPKYSSKAASSRYRVYSYLSYYKEAGLKFSVHPLLGDWYIESLWRHQSKFLVLPQLIYHYITRIVSILFIPKSTIVYVGADLLPFFPPILEWYLHTRGVKYILELDDAIFHRYDDNSHRIVRFLYSNKYRYVTKWASAIICGSGYLADYCKRWNDQVYLIPTSIDENKYNIVENDLEQKNLVVGWIGSPETSKYVLSIIPVIRELQKIVEFEFHLIGFDRIYEDKLHGCDYKIIQWSSDTEVNDLGTFSIGIMPLDDSPFSRGKCAFKLIQYMAVGIPTVSTPMQSNIEVDKGCGNLFASTPEEWRSCLLKLLTDNNLRRQIGKQNKEMCKKHFTIQHNSSKYLEIIKLCND